VAIPSPLPAPESASGGFGLSGFLLLEFDRKPIGRVPLRGFVIEWKADLTLVQIFDNELFVLDGYAVFRNCDVKRWRCIRADEFLARAAKLKRLRLSAPIGVTIDSMSAALSSAGKSFPLITIHQERINKEVCFVGKYLGTTQRALRILSINPEAQWEAEDVYRPKDITLLEFGGTYEILLNRMAGKAKSAPPPRDRGKS